MTAPNTSGSAPREQKPQNKPLYSDAQRGLAVFPDYVTNPTTKETSEFFTYVEGKGENAVRIGRIPTTIGGYELQNNQAKGYSDVVDLVDGKELVRHGVGKGEQAAEYAQIIAPLGIADVPRTNAPGITDKRLELYVATAYLRKGAEFDQEGRPNVESFNIHSKPAKQGEEQGKRDLKCWRHIPIEGSINPRTQKPRWFELRVSDALKARDAIARGETYSFEHNGVKISCSGMSAPKQGEQKTLKPTLEFKAVQLAQQKQTGRPQGANSFGYRGGGSHDGNSVPDPGLIPLPDSPNAAASQSASARR